MKTKLIARGSLLGASMFALAACGTPGGLNGLDNSPDADPLPRMTYACSDGHCTADQLMVFAVAAAVANHQIAPQLSGKLESGATGCALYGASGAAAGATQSVFYPGALTGAAAGYGFAYGCFSGAANGLYTFSYAVDASTGFHTEQILRDWENGTKVPEAVRNLFPNVEDLCAGMHVSASYIRTHNHSPALPVEFHGDGDGTPFMARPGPDASTGATNIPGVTPSH